GVNPVSSADERGVRRGESEPAGVLWHADFVETLAATGARAEAARVLAQVTDVAEELKRETAMLGLTRAGAVLTSMDGDPRAAAAELTAAMDRWSDHPFPIEVASAYHELSTIARRTQRRGEARAAFTQTSSWG